MKSDKKEEAENVEEIKLKKQISARFGCCAGIEFFIRFKFHSSNQTLLECKSYRIAKLKFN